MATEKSSTTSTTSTATTQDLRPAIARAKQGEAVPAANSTAATEGQPLAVRARARQAELEAALAKTPAHDDRTRRDLQLALTTIAELLTGDTEHLTETTSSDINTWLERSKHLGELAPRPAGNTKH